MRKTAFALVLASSAMMASPLLAEDEMTGFDQWAEAARQEWQIPGFSVAVVKGDKTIYAKGFGVKDIRTNDPMTADTVSLIASTTKAFASMSLAMLVDEGKLAWDDRVIDHLPNWRVSDPYVTRETRVGDLLTHNTGFEANNSPWVRGLSTDETLARMKDLPQANSFRSRYQYNNLAYLVAGEVVEAISGLSFGEFVKQRIWQPLGMSDSFYRWDNIKDHPRLGGAHGMRDDESPYPMNYNSIEESGAAGMLNSTVEDHAKWLRFILARGVWNGERLVSEERFDEIFTPRIVFGGPSYPAAGETDGSFFTYGYGWFIQNFEGRTIAFHTGSMGGLNAINAVIPEEGVGMVALFNREASELRHAMMYEVLDRFTDGHSGKNWSTDIHAIYSPRWDRGEARYKEFYNNPRPDAAASLAFEGYAGTFTNPVVGDVTVSVGEDGVLKLDMPPKLSYRLDHHHHDVFLAWDINQPVDVYYSSTVNFSLDNDGKVEALEVRGDTFKRVE